MLNVCEGGLAPPDPLVRRRAREIEVEKEARRLIGAAQIADGKQQGETYKVICPKGLNALIQPVGQGQVDEIDGIFTRAEARGLLTNATLSPVFTSLRAKRNELQAAVDRRKAGYTTLAGAMTAAMIAREDFCTGYSKEIGLIRSIYPNDRTMQEFFFDTFRKSGGGSIARSPHPPVAVSPRQRRQLLDTWLEHVVPLTRIDNPCHERQTSSRARRGRYERLTDSGARDLGPGEGRERAVRIVERGRPGSAPAPP
jgi:hypothetical protein